MVWLMGELVVYLGCAAAIGFVAGWLLRGIRTAETREVLEERFRQMLASAEMERDAARIRVRELGYQLDAMEERVEVLLGESQDRSFVPSDDVPMQDVSAPPLSSPADGDSSAFGQAAPGHHEVQRPEAPPEVTQSPTPAWAQDTIAHPDEERERGVTPATDQNQPPSSVGPPKGSPDASLPRTPSAPSEPATTQAADTEARLVPEQPPLGAPSASRSGDVSGTPSHDRMGGLRDAEEEEAAALWRQALERPVSRWKTPEGIPSPVPTSEAADPSVTPGGEAPPAHPAPQETVPSPSPTSAGPVSSEGPPPGSLGDVAGLPRDIRASLESLGVVNTRQLARRTRSSTDQDDLAASLGVEPRLVRRWGGLADLMQVPGVGPEEARLLEASGLGSVVELADEDPTELSQRMALLNRDQGLGLPAPGRDEVQRWIRFAAEASGTLQST